MTRWIDRALRPHLPTWRRLAPLDATALNPGVGVVSVWRTAHFLVRCKFAIISTLRNRCKKGALRCKTYRLNLAVPTPQGQFFLIVSFVLIDNGAG